MAKVVYLLGAGASFGLRDGQTIKEGLPIVSEIPQRLEYVIQEIENIRLDSLPNDNIEIIDRLRKGLLNDFTWLKTESANHATIDTFAKKLWLTHKADEYSKLKRLLAIYFIIEQIINIPDSRYDTFLANILTPELIIPPEIVVITWNYDYQFDIAYKVYSKAAYKFIQYNGVIKLNGSATFKEIPFQIVEECGRDTPHKLTLPLLRHLLKSYNTKTSDLAFAWENDNQFDDNSQLAMSVQDASTLVVIGYTFPFFNRVIDRKLMSYMKNLHTIYIQDPNAMQVLDNIAPVLPNNSNYKIEPKINVQQFYLPAEL